MVGDLTSLKLADRRLNTRGGAVKQLTDKEGCDGLCGFSKILPMPHIQDWEEGVGSIERVKDSDAYAPHRTCAWYETGSPPAVLVGIHAGFSSLLSCTYGALQRYDDV